MRILEVLDGEGSDVFCDVVVLVAPRALAEWLYERMDAAIDQESVAVDADGNNGGVAEGAGDTDTRRGAEVSKAIGDEMAFVDFHGTADMGSVAVDDVGAIVDT